MNSEPLSESIPSSFAAACAPYPIGVYGDTDNGGTQALYLSHVPFEKLGLPELPISPLAKMR